MREIADDDRDEMRLDVIARGFSIIQAFRPRNPWLSVTELAESTGLPRPTVVRFTQMLIGKGHLVVSRESGKLRLGPKAAELSRRDMPGSHAMLLLRDALQQVVEPTSAILRIHCAVDGETRLVATLRSTTRDCAVLAATPVNRSVDLAIQATTARDCTAEHGSSAARTTEAEELARKDFCTRLRFGPMRGLSAVVATMRLSRTEEVYAFELVGAAAELPANAIDFNVGPALAHVARTVSAEIGRTEASSGETSIQRRCARRGEEADLIL